MLEKAIPNRSKFRFEICCNIFFIIIDSPIKCFHLPHYYIIWGQESQTSLEFPQIYPYSPDFIGFILTTLKKCLK